MLKKSYDTLDAVPEALREHYVKSEGKFVLEVEGHKEQIARLNGEAKGHRERAERAEAKLGELANADQELRLARQHEKEAIVETRLGMALAKAKATLEGTELLRELLSRRIDIATQDGRRVIRILGSDGKPQVGATIESMVNEARARFPGAFLSLAGYGGGASSRPAPAGSRTISRAEFDRLGPEARVAKMASGMTVVD